ncbi:MAG: hypothetical protein ABI206_01205 [Antricoccus sp.]
MATALALAGSTGVKTGIIGVATVLRSPQGAVVQQVEFTPT